MKRFSLLGTSKNLMVRRSGGRGYEKQHVTDLLNPFLQLKNKLGKSKNKRSEVCRGFLLFGLCSGLWSGVALASVEWRLVGEGTATWLFMDIYQAKLYRPVNSTMQQFLVDKTPLKLELCYYKPITPDIFIQGANEVLPETLSAELRVEVDRLHASYQSVKPNDCYVLQYQDSVTELLLNQRPIFRSTVPEFKSVYFGIWLGDKALSDKLKSALLASRD